MIQIKNLTCGYGESSVLRDITLSLPAGQITTLVGPNGCGKTTLLRAAARQLPLQSGSITVDGRPLADYQRKEFARTVAFMPQLRSVPAISVQGLVSHGRYPHLGFSRRFGEEDRQTVYAAMAQTGVMDWADRDLRTLSGGERQRVYIAMALAQQAQVLLLDEPATYLDPGRQFELLDLIRTLNRQQGKTVVLVLHDLAHALRYSDHIAVLNGGELVLCGTPDEVAASGALQRVFGVQLHRTPQGFLVAPQSSG